MTFFRPGDNCWRVVKADSFTVLVDGENYFRAVRSAMQQARQRIVLIGWDFDARVKMYDTQGEPTGPLEMGEYIDWLVQQNPDLHIYILHWNLGALKFLKRGRTLLKASQWLAHPRVHVALDDAHPTGAAQHEKLIIVDQSTAFCGGIDITEDRWDTRAHRANEPKRKQPDDHDSGPWHDAATRLTGEVVQSLGEHAERRWKAVTGERLVSVTDGEEPALNSQPDTLLIGNVDVAIARTRGRTEQFEAVSEIESLTIDLIGAARRTLYIESQYLTSKTVGTAIAKALEKTDGPEIVLLIPASADGWLEPLVMDSKRARLIETLRALDHEQRFSVYHPVTAEGDDIYVHAKILIADHRFLRVGSSNLANRSMGFDSECDVCINAVSTDRQDETQNYIRNVLHDLLGEHLGAEPERVGQLLEATGSMRATIETLSEEGRGLREYQTPDLCAVQEWLSKNDVLDPQATESSWPSINL